MGPGNQHVHPQYTLPGIMHYLQTEFTKNERDRISWELERFEMKARIAKLEGENRDLNYRLKQLMNAKAGASATMEDEGDVIDSKLLVNSRQAIQENVKEIIYLLKNTDINVINGNNVLNTNDNLHYLESLNANTNVNKPKVAVPIVNTTETPSQTQSHHLQQIQQNNTTEKPSQIILANEHIKRIDTMKVTADGSIVISGDNYLEIFKLDSGNLQKIHSTIYTGAYDNTLDVFVSKNNILSIHEGCLQSWLINNEDSMDSMDFKTNFDPIQIELLKAVEFKNDWLLLVTNDMLKISKLILPSESSKKICMQASKDIEKIQTNSSILGATLGMTEKSVIVLYNNPAQLIIYDFDGNILQQIDISNSLKSIDQPLYTLTGLYINKETSNLLIQADKQILIYSIDQRKIILNESLTKTPLHISYKFQNDLITITYSDRSVEIRNIGDFNKTLYRYDSLDEQIIVDIIIINDSPVIVLNTWDNKLLLYKLDQK